MSPSWSMRRSPELFERRGTPSGNKIATPSGINLTTPSGNKSSRRMDSFRTASSTPSGIKNRNTLVNKSFNYFNGVFPAHSFFCYSTSNIIDVKDNARNKTGKVTHNPAHIGKIWYIDAIGRTIRSEKRVGTHLGYSHLISPSKYPPYLRHQTQKSATSFSKDRVCTQGQKSTSVYSGPNTRGDTAKNKKRVGTYLGSYPQDTSGKQAALKSYTDTKENHAQNATQNSDASAEGLCGDIPLTILGNGSPKTQGEAGGYAKKILMQI